MTPLEALEYAGRRYSGVRVFNGDRHPLLQELAQGHAEYMATRNRGGHQWFLSRFDRVAGELSMVATEICAQSWTWQAESPLVELGEEMFRCWEQSPGHWRVASSPHVFYGAWRGIWFACVLVADPGDKKERRDFR